jgi:RNA polymerase sigma factor (sigma-70 family)
LTLSRHEGIQSDPSASPTDALAAEETRRRVRRAIDRLSERDRQMLLLRAEGYAYRDIAGILDLNEASVGTLLSRAKNAFREAYEGETDAP